MSTHRLDLDAYCARIGYQGPRTATLDTLVALHERHIRAIPFENLDVILGRGIRIDVASIEQKLIRDRRGGYCFEQNTLFAAALRGVGFGVTPFIARVRWQLPPELETALTHMLLRVEVPDAGTFIADVGFGSMSLIRPLRFEFDAEQTAALEPRRLIRRERHVVQQARFGDTWSDVYLFVPEPVPNIDFELGNWFTSTHPQSRFVLNLIASRAGENCRYTLLNREFSMRYADGRADKRDVQSPKELLTLLAEYFDLNFPPGTRFGRPGAAWPV